MKMYEEINKLLIENNLPEFGTKEFNELCSQMFGGKSKTIDK